MSGRRNGNQIRGPKSALTDFLATHGISAAQIRDEYNTRVAAAAAAESADQPATANEAREDDAEAEQQAAEAAIERSRKRKREQDEVIAEIKTKKGKNKSKSKKKDKKKKGSDDEDDDDFEDFIGKKIYQKAPKLPGQLENCEICEKRFTVTPYSKAGPDGGLLCTPCGKEIAKETKKDAKPKRAPGAGRHKRKVESDRLDGKIRMGAKALQQLCIEKVVSHAAEVEDFGDMPPDMMERLSEIFTKRRVLKANTLSLFLQPESPSVVIHDCAYLESNDFKQIFAVVPNIERLSLSNACQFKNETMEYMTEKAHRLTYLQLYAANLISNDRWSAFFKQRGHNLEALKLAWLDASFDDEQVEEIAQFCPNLERLKLERCRRIGVKAIRSITKMSKLKHITLWLSHQVPNEDLLNMVIALGPNLETLCLDGFRDADDTIIEAIKINCPNLRKFRLSDNDVITDEAYASLFTNSTMTPLRYADFSITRDVDNMNPAGPKEAPIGLGSDGLRALMAHSASKIEYLNLASCRHISHEALMAVFPGDDKTVYPSLREVDFSFVNTVDTVILAGLFKSCPNITKVIAFGCFGVEDVIVPRNVVLIGVPRAQDAIERFGGQSEAFDVDADGALAAMVAMQLEQEEMVEAMEASVGGEGSSGWRDGLRGLVHAAA